MAGGWLIGPLTPIGHGPPRTGIKLSIPGRKSRLMPVKYDKRRNLIEVATPANSAGVSRHSA